MESGLGWMAQATSTCRIGCGNGEARVFKAFEANNSKKICLASENISRPCFNHISYEYSLPQLEALYAEALESGRSYAAFQTF